MGWKYSKDLAKQIAHYAKFPAQSVPMRQMVQFGPNPTAGTLFRASQFVQEELPIRLGHRIRDLEELPDGLADAPSVKRVREWYAMSFEELVNVKQPKLSSELKQWLYKPTQVRNVSGIEEFPVDPARDFALKAERGRNQDVPKSDGNRHSYSERNRRYFAHVEPNVLWPAEIGNYNREMTKALQIIKRRHDAVIPTIAQGVAEWKRTSTRSNKQSVEKPFLDKFTMSRIGVRMLIGQHIALNTEPGRNDYVGIICTRTNVYDVIQQSIDGARFICETHYGLLEAPQVDIVCDPSLEIMYVPGHLAHMLFEMVKNSLRAVVEFHGVHCESFPAVKIIVAVGHEDITIKIHDQGGGIPRSSIRKVWQYTYSTVADTPELNPENNSEFKAPMAGFGYGLPLSRLYAQYFGGDLELISMEGYGTDVYLNLNRLSSSSEPLQ